MDSDQNTIHPFDPNLSVPSPSKSPKKRAKTAHNTADIDPQKLADKREKARVRQRRKRERDKKRDSELVISTPSTSSALPGPSTATPTATQQPIHHQHVAHYQHQHPHHQHHHQQHHQQLQQQLQQQPQQHQQPPQQQLPQQPPQPQQSQDEPQRELTQEELDAKTRRERVKEAARLRQRKHRALVKKRKLAELGLINVDNLGQVEEAHYALGPDGQYLPVPVMPPPPLPHELASTDTYPQGQTGGQTFAATTLLAFASTPLLKQHIMTSLHMSNEEIASLEPILAAAWDQWDHARRMHYSELAAKSQGNGQPNGAEAPDQHHQHPHSPFVPPHMSAIAQMYAQLHAQTQAQQGVNPAEDFRARFSRSLTAPSPYLRAGTGAGPSSASASTVANAQNNPLVAIAAAVAAAAQKVNGFSGILQAPPFAHAQNAMPIAGSSGSNAQSQAQLQSQGAGQIDPSLSRGRSTGKKRKATAPPVASVDMSLNEDEEEGSTSFGDGDGDADEAPALEVLEKE